MAALNAPGSGPPRLELIGITKEFPGVRALDGVSFDCRAGEIHALCGENGAGKSTLIKILCGYHPHGSFGGRLRLAGRDAALRSLRDAEAQGVALIAQELALAPNLSVAENLLLGREPRRLGLIDRAAAAVAAREALARVGLDVAPERLVRTLGVGQQQLVEIARALAKEASILVLDEPTAALTEADAARLLDRLRDLKAAGVSIVYISHRLDEVLAVADRVTVLRDGHSVSTRARADVTRAQVIAEMVGREVRDLYPRAPHRPGARLLSVRDWTLDDPLNPGRRVLADVSFDLHAGEVLGVAGLMGAGRTALLTSLFGAARSRVTGQVGVGAATPGPPFRTPGAAIAAGLALVGEDRQRDGLVPGASVADNLSLATLARFTRGGALDLAARDAACAATAAGLRIRTPSLRTPAGQLSGGNQQKVLLGRWLMEDVRVLLLDEPTRGIDVGARAEIYALVNELVGRGLGVLLVSSDLPELLGLSHRLLVLSLGRRTALLEGAEMTAAAVMGAATARGAA